MAGDVPNQADFDALRLQDFAEVGMR